jgi:hypothetical protein
MKISETHYDGQASWPVLTLPESTVPSEVVENKFVFHCQNEVINSYTKTSIDNIEIPSILYF